MKEYVKKMLKSSRFGKWLYEPIHRTYQLYSIPHRRRMLRRHGVAVLSVLAEIFNRRQIPAFAAYGTLLGFVRDGGFLPHDDDIDIGILPGDWTAQRVLRTLIKDEIGFSFIHGFTYNDKLTEFTVSYAGLSIDFFFYQDDGAKFFAGSYHYHPDFSYPSVNANSAQRVVEPRIEGLGKINVFGVDFPIPANEEFVLERLYGNWRIPDKDWDDSKHPGIEDLPGFAYRITDVEVLI